VHCRSVGLCIAIWPVLRLLSRLGPAAASGDSLCASDSRADSDEDDGGGGDAFPASWLKASDVPWTDRRSGIDPRVAPGVSCRPASSGGYSTLAKSSSSKDSGSMKIVDCGEAR
jgi:hypothetical protein